MKIVDPALRPDKESGAKAKTGLTKAQFTDVFMTLVKTAAESFKDKWNTHNPEDLIDLRFVLSRNKVTSHTQIKAQAMLTFELRRNGTWTVSARKIKNFAAERQLKDLDEDYTFELWSDMFSEITQIGFISVINYLANKDSEQIEAQDDQRPVISGDSEEVEHLSTES